MGPKLASSQTLIRRGAATGAIVAAVPALYAPNPEAAKRFIEYFAANIRNVNTRRAYLHAVREFADWCALQGFHEIVDIEPLHVAGYIEQLAARLAKPSVKQHLAAIRMLFDWLVVGQVMATNPAAPVRGPKYTVKKGKTPVLTQDEARELLEKIDTSTLLGLRDRALIAMMIYTFGRVGAVLKMRIEDYYTQGRRGWVRLHEKGGKRHEMPCNHNLEAYLDEYLKAAGISEDFKGYLFRTAKGKSGTALTSNPLAQSNVYRMIVSPQGSTSSRSKSSGADVRGSGTGCFAGATRRARFSAAA